MRCNCESSKCDHEGACARPADSKYRMWAVGECCTPCAENMIASGGAIYVWLAEVVG